jgi:hypothetical protein
MFIETDMQSPEYYDVTPEGQKAIEKKDWKTLLKNVKFCSPEFYRNIVTLEERILTELKSKKIGKEYGPEYGQVMSYGYDKIDKADLFQHIKVKDLGDDLMAIAWLDCVEASVNKFGGIGKEQRMDGFIIDTKNKQIVQRLYNDFKTIKAHSSKDFYDEKNRYSRYVVCCPEKAELPKKEEYRSGVVLGWDPMYRQLITAWLNQKKDSCNPIAFRIPERHEIESKWKKTTLKKGIAFNDYDLIKESLEAGANPNIMLFTPHLFCDCPTALYRYVKQRKYGRSPQKELKIVDLLLRHGASLNNHDCSVYEPDGPNDKPEYNGGRWIEDTTVLTQAVVDNDLEMVKLLINHGAVPSEEDLKCAEKHCPRDRGWAVTEGNVMYELLQNTIKKIKRDETIKRQVSQRKEQRKILAELPKGKRKKSTLMETLKQGTEERNEKANELKQARKERDFKAKEEIRLQKEKAFKAHVGLLKQRKKADPKRSTIVATLDKLNTLAPDRIRKTVKETMVRDYHSKIAKPEPQEKAKPQVSNEPPKSQTNKKTQQKGIVSRLFGGGRK